MQNILITGATGFIGRALCDKLLADGIHIRAAVWREEPVVSLQEGIGRLLAIGPERHWHSLEAVPIDSIGPDTDWTLALKGIDTVIHLAARVHVMDENEGEPLTAYRRVNVAGTERLARMSAANGVKRLVFMSLVKVHGEENSARYTEQDNPAPLDPYGVSKLEAEEVLKKI